MTSWCQPRFVRLVAKGVGTAVVLLLGSATAPAPASAEPASASAPAQTPPALGAAPSDPRATFHEGNVTTCADVGYPDDVQVGAAGNAAASDAYVQGTVTGSDPESLQVTITPAGLAAGVQVDAVVAKGGNGYNVYQAPYVPPGAAPPQNYVPPLANDGAPVADFSHWFVCYSIPAPAQGALVVAKEVIPPPGPPVESLPTQYTAQVTCTDAVGTVVAEDTFTFGAGGGLGTTSSGAHALTGIPVGSTCTVAEQGTGAFPSGATVRYIPDGANTTNVTIDNSVGIVNDFSNVAVQKGSIQVNKVVVGGQVGLPASFQVGVICTDGTVANVTVPGTGGPGTPVVDGITADSYCAVAEVGVPEGVTVTYSVDGGPPTDRIAALKVVPNTTVTVTVTNTVSNVTTTTTTPAPTTTMAPTTTTPSSNAHSGSPRDCRAGAEARPGDCRLADTGTHPGWALAGVGLLTVGGLAVFLSRRLALRST